MHRHGTRERKVGVPHPLLVCRCATHGRSFTVYPPGHVPYGRISMTSVDSEGREVVDEGEAGTVLRGALEASGEVAPTLDRRTQGRWIGLIADVVGLRGASAEVEGWISETLSVPAVELREAGRRYAASVTWAERAREVLRLVRSVVGARRTKGLLVCGFLAKRWGIPSWWDPVGRTLAPLFHVPGTAAAKG